MESPRQVGEYTALLKAQTDDQDDPEGVEKMLWSVEE